MLEEPIRLADTELHFYTRDAAVGNFGLLIIAGGIAVQVWTSRCV